MISTGTVPGNSEERICPAWGRDVCEIATSRFERDSQRQICPVRGRGRLRLLDDEGAGMFFQQYLAVFTLPEQVELFAFLRRGYPLQ